MALEPFREQCAHTTPDWPPSNFFVIVTKGHGGKAWTQDGCNTGGISPVPSLSRSSRPGSQVASCEAFQSFVCIPQSKDVILFKPDVRLMLVHVTATASMHSYDDSIHWRGGAGTEYGYIHTKCTVSVKRKQSDSEDTGTIKRSCRWRDRYGRVAPVLPPRTLTEWPP